MLRPSCLVVTRPHPSSPVAFSRLLNDLNLSPSLVHVASLISSLFHRFRPLSFIDYRRATASLFSRLAILVYNVESLSRRVLFRPRTTHHRPASKRYQGPLLTTVHRPPFRLTYSFANSVDPGCADLKIPAFTWTAAC